MRKGVRQPGLAAESDKDSGFSDGGSECLSSVEQLEAEDRLSAAWSCKNVHSCRPTGHAPSAQAPVVVMKNVLVKQGSGSSGLQSWTVQPSFEVLPGQPQILLLHPPVQPHSSPGHAGDRKPPDTRDYLPILNSYPKIAPHPGKRACAPGPEERAERGPQKRACPQHRPCRAPAAQGTPTSTPGGSPRTLAPTPAHRLAPAPSPPPMGPTSPACAVDSTLLPPLSPPLGTPQQLPQQSKHRRFQNTLVVLRRSGLLEITLQTKELLRQNQATQRELERLRQHTQLLLEAAGGSDPQAWAQLQAALGPTRPDPPAV